MKKQIPSIARKSEREKEGKGSSRLCLCRHFFIRKSGRREAVRIDNRPSATSKGVTIVRVACSTKGRERQIYMYIRVSVYARRHTTAAPDNSPEVVKTGRLSNTRDNPFDHPVRFTKNIDNNTVINGLSVANY